MELTPELLLEAKFGPSRRGYDMAEVDDFLERVAELVEIMLSRVAAEFDRAEANADQVTALQARLAEVDASPNATPSSTLAAPAPSVVDPAATAVPTPEPPPISADEPMRILIHAERTAEAAIAEAKAEAERIRNEAEASSSAMTTDASLLLDQARTTAELEARKAGESARRAVLEELATLRSDRDHLTEDTRALKRWLDDQRGRMRTTARDLQRLVDDPAALREVAIPSLSDADVSDDDLSDAGSDEGSEEASSAAVEAEDFGPGAHDDGEQTQAVPVIDDAVIFDVESEDVKGGFSPADTPESGTDAERSPL